MCLYVHVYVYVVANIFYMHIILYIFLKNETILKEKIFLQDPESFQCAIGPILGLAQLFGVLPVSGVRAPTPLKLKFAIFSFLTAYAVFVTVMVLVAAILAIMHMIRTLNSTTFEVKGKQR